MMRKTTTRIALALLAALSISCKGADGAVGPAGPQGPRGLTGSANVATFAGLLSSVNGADLGLPSDVTFSNLPVFSCYISTQPTGPWIPVPYSFSSTAPLCALVVLPGGGVEIRLRQWVVGTYYYVVASWK